jgi:hypothetical protein
MSISPKSHGPVEVGPTRVNADRYGATVHLSGDWPGRPSVARVSEWVNPDDSVLSLKERPIALAE